MVCQTDRLADGDEFLDGVLLVEPVLVEHARSSRRAEHEGIGSLNVAGKHFVRLLVSVVVVDESDSITLVSVHVDNSGRLVERTVALPHEF